MQKFDDQLKIAEGRHEVVRDGEGEASKARGQASGRQSQPSSRRPGKREAILWSEDLCVELISSMSQ